MCAVSAYTLAATPCPHHRHQHVGRLPRYAHGLGISPGEEDVSEMRMGRDGEVDAGKRRFMGNIAQSWSTRLLMTLSP